MSDPYDVEQANDLRNLAKGHSDSLEYLDMIIKEKGTNKWKSAVAWMALASHKTSPVSSMQKLCSHMSSVFLDYPLEFT